MQDVCAVSAWLGCIVLHLHTSHTCLTERQRNLFMAETQQTWSVCRTNAACKSLYLPAGFIKSSHSSLIFSALPVTPLWKWADVYSVIVFQQRGCWLVLFPGGFAMATWQRKSPLVVTVDGVFTTEGTIKFWSSVLNLRGNESVFFFCLFRFNFYFLNLSLLKFSMEVHQSYYEIISAKLKVNVKSV